MPSGPICSSWPWLLWSRPHHLPLCRRPRRRSRRTRGCAAAPRGPALPWADERRSTNLAAAAAWPIPDLCPARPARPHPSRGPPPPDLVPHEPAWSRRALRAGDHRARSAVGWGAEGGDAALARDASSSQPRSCACAGLCWAWRGRGALRAFAAPAPRLTLHSRGQAARWRNASVAMWSSSGPGCSTT